MAAQPDFWGDLAPAGVRTPLSILREQAALLGTKTKNLVEATVTTRTDDDLFVHYFNLIVPALDNYTYGLFAISHAIDLYPVRVRSRGLSLPSEEAFLDWLQQELSSDKTRRIVTNLLSQVSH